MKRLILMRHAKSDWKQNLPDAARPLNGRGRRASRAIGLWLHDVGYTPDEVLCSSATRTRETLDNLAMTAPTCYRKSLYLADAETMLGALRDRTGECVLMIGHNPGIADLAHVLVANAPNHERWDDFPTCATLVADFDIPSWQALAPASGAPVAFAVGRDLTD